MRRGRGKGRRLTVVRSHEDTGSGGEEPLPAFKRRGRPQRPMKDDINEEDIQKIEEEGDDAKLPISAKESEVTIVVESVKNKRYARAKENDDSIMEENGDGVKSIIEESSKPNGFRQRGSRRKSKPCRAAEVGVKCK